MWLFCKITTDVLPDDGTIGPETCSSNVLLDLLLWTCNSDCILLVKVTVKQSHYSPWQTLRVEEVKAPRFLNNRHMKVVRLSALRTGRLYLQEILLVLISVRDWVDPRAIVRPEGLCEWKIPMTPSEIEPATFRLVEQCLNQLRHRVPPPLLLLDNKNRFVHANVKLRRNGDRG
jgi:hypothetical protein